MYGDFAAAGGLALKGGWGSERPEGRSGGFLAIPLPGQLFDRQHLLRAGPPEALFIQLLEENRQRRLPGFLLVVRDLAQLLRIQAQFARHLDMSVR